jgi:hypothetical protein
LKRFHPKSLRFFHEMISAEKSHTFRIFDSAMSWVDSYRKLDIRANAEIPRQTQTTVQFRVKAIGRCSTSSKRLAYRDRSIVSIRKQGCFLRETRTVKSEVIHCDSDAHSTLRAMVPSLMAVDALQLVPWDRAASCIMLMVISPFNWSRELRGPYFPVHERNGHFPVDWMWQKMRPTTNINAASSVGQFEHPHTAENVDIMCPTAVQNGNIVASPCR